MKRCSKNCLATACLFLFALFPLTSIAQSTDSTPHAPHDAIAAEFDKLGEEYDHLWKAEIAQPTKMTPVPTKKQTTNSPTRNG